MTRQAAEKKGKQSKDSPNFEKSMGRLEEIVKKMDAGELDLEQMIAHFEEGQKLLKFCTGKLEEVERRIEILVKKGDKIEVEPCDDGEGGEKDAGPDGQLEEGELF